MMRPSAPYDGDTSLAAPRGGSQTQPIHPVRRAAEDRFLLGGRRAGGQALEHVPQRRHADAHLLDRIVALDHAAVGTEQVDAGLDVRPPVAGERLGRWRRRQLAVVVGGEPHGDAAELHRHVGTLGELGHRRLPVGEDLVLLAGIGAVAQRAAHVTHDDAGIGEGARQVDGLGELRMEQPGIEHQAELLQALHAGADSRVEIEAGADTPWLLPMMGSASQPAE